MGSSSSDLGYDAPKSAASAGSEVPSAWRPIETAPKDGTKIRAFCPDASHTYKTYVLRWSNPRPKGPDPLWEHFNDGRLFDWPATHWAPMSEPEPKSPPPGPYPDLDDSHRAMTAILATPYLGAHAAQMLLALRGVDKRYRPDIDRAAAEHGWHSEEHWGLVREVEALATAVFDWFKAKGDPAVESYNWISAVQAVRYNRNPFRERDLVGIAGPAMS